MSMIAESIRFDLDLDTQETLEVDYDVERFI